MNSICQVKYRTSIELNACREEGNTTLSVYVNALFGYSLQKRPLKAFKVVIVKSGTRITVKPLMFAHHKLSVCLGS